MVNVQSPFAFRTQLERVNQLRIGMFCLHCVFASFFLHLKNYLCIAMGAGGRDQ